MAQIEICFDGNGSFTTVDFDTLPAILEKDHAFAWIDVDAGKPDELHGLQQQFGLHKIAVESALERDQRARITLYDEAIYLEFYGLHMVDGEIVAADIGIFLGEKYLITARHRNQPSLEPIQQRWRDAQVQPNGNHAANRTNRARRSPTSAMLLYAILDELVDGYFGIVESLGDQVEDLEDRVLAASAIHPNREIQEMRTRLLRLRRLLSPEQEVLNTLLRRDVPVIDEALIPYFADVYDHLLRMHDWMETYRDQLSSIVDLQLAMQSHRLDRTIRTLTLWSIILMSSTLVAGIYGMNFEHMPELAWQYGYPLALGLMAVLGVGLYAYFRRIDWW